MRALLKRGAEGDTEAYLVLAGLYFDLISEHLYLCNLDRREALQRAEILLRDGWKQLAFLKRLSDWEYFLARRLVAMEVSGAYVSDGPRPPALLELPGELKFALIAFDLEGWSYPWLKLALRVSQQDLREILFETRCQVLNIDLDNTSAKLRQCLELVSADLDGQLGSAQQRQLLKTLCSCQETKTFKSRWLDYRCQLIELRQQIRLQADERDSFLHGFAESLALEEMVRPSIPARIRNIFSFRGLEAAPVVPAPRDFRYGR